MSQIKRYALLFWLTLKSFMRPSYFLIFLVLAPASLGFIAGLGNRANLSCELRVAIVDQLEDEDSAALIEYFQANHWDILLADRETAQQWLRHGEVKAVVTIKPELKAYLEGKSREPFVEVEMEEASLMQLSLMMTVAAFGDSEQLIREFENELASLAAKAGQDPEIMRAKYQERMAQYENGLAEDPIVFDNRTDQPRRSILVGDYSLLLLYLAVAAVSQISLWERPIRRLLAIPGAWTRDFLLTYAVNLLMGLSQVLVYSLMMTWAAGRPFLASSLLTLLVYLVSVQTLAFWLLLLPKDTRLFIGLLLAFLLALPGGVLFPLPGPTMLNFGQYTPMGWAMANLSGLETRLSSGLVSLVALGLTCLAAWAVQEQGRRHSQI